MQTRFYLIPFPPHGLELRGRERTDNFRRFFCFLIARNLAHCGSTLRVYQDGMFQVETTGGNPRQHGINMYANNSGFDGRFSLRGCATMRTFPSIARWIGMQLDRQLLTLVYVVVCFIDYAGATYYARKKFHDEEEVLTADFEKMQKDDERERTGR